MTRIKLKPQPRFLAVADIPSLFVAARYPRGPYTGPDMESAALPPDEVQKGNDALMQYERHCQQLVVAAIRKGNLKAWPADAQTEEYDTGRQATAENAAFVRVSDFAKWAADCNFDVCIEAGPTADEIKPSTKAATPAVTNRPHEKGTAWSDDELRRLLDEHSRGRSQADLAEFHGVSRPLVSRLIKQARGRFTSNAEIAVSIVGQLDKARRAKGP